MPEGARPTRERHAIRPVAEDAQARPAHAEPARGTGLPLLPLLVATRPEQWVKNFFVFAALLFGQKLGDPEAVRRSLLAFFIFCALSGSVYLINDVCDLPHDRRHPGKRQRPVASGRLPVPFAITSAALLAGGALAASLLLPGPFLWCAAGYLALNLVYSFGLKNVVILDVLAIAGGFVLRAVGGGEAIPVAISEWLVLCTMLLALFLGFGKRRHELTLLQEDARHHRASLHDYSIEFLDQMITVVLSATVVAYSFYTISAQVAEKFRTPYLPLTIPFVLYGIFRYLYLIHHKREGGSPARTLFTDPPILADVALWAVSVGIILYLV